MREVITYVAYDGKVFDNCEACEAYEGYIYNILTDIGEKYSFFDKNMNVFFPPNGSPDIEDWIEFFEGAIDDSFIIYREENLTDEENLFMLHELSYSFCNEDFNNKIGWFRWNENEMKWAKMGE